MLIRANGAKGTAAQHLADTDNRLHEEPAHNQKMRTRPASSIMLQPSGPAAE